MKEKTTESREGVKGGIPPCGVKGRSSLVGFGATPQLLVVKPTMPNALKLGNLVAGSEASLPVTSRVRRRAPNLLYPPLAHCRAKWARPSISHFLLY